MYDFLFLDVELRFIEAFNSVIPWILSFLFLTWHHHCCLLMFLPILCAKLEPWTMDMSIVPKETIGAGDAEYRVRQMMQVTFSSSLYCQLRHRKRIWL